jgi:hypothetical protein
MDAVKRALSANVLLREQNLVLEVFVGMWYANWDLQEWLRPHMDNNLAKYRFACHVFRWCPCINGQTYNDFIQFAIKLVMATNDTTKVPVIEDIRALALPPGTGI